MNEKTAFEIERKFLIMYPDTVFLEKHAFSKTEIVQTYLVRTDGEHLRLRSCFDGSGYKYIKTIKKHITDLRRLETESEITKEEYLALLSRCDVCKKQLTKTRYRIMYKDQCFEIDIFPFMKDTAIMETELSDESDKIFFPDYIHIIREVSHEAEYRNFSMARSIN